MSRTVREQPDDRQIELGTASNWPLILALASVGVVILTTAIVPALFAAARAMPEKELALKEQPRTLPKPRTVRLPMPADPQTESCEPLAPPVVAKPTVPRIPEPLPAVVAAPSEPATVVVNSVAAVPAPVQPVVEAAAPSPPSFKRRHGYDEGLLREKLIQEARELDLETEKGASAKLLESFKKAAVKVEKGSGDQAVPQPPIYDLVAQRADLKGLPMRNLSDCQLDKRAAAIVALLSREVRRVAVPRGSRSQSSGSRFSEESARTSTLLSFLEGSIHRELNVKDEVGNRTLVQMLQVEHYSVRLQLVAMLAENKGKSASIMLAQRAVFDLSSEVREAAVKALKNRLRDEYRSVLLEALRYPWSVAADHAAEALVALKDDGAVFGLACLLDEPDPLAPTQDKEKNWTVKELVRVNHLGNCLLCHAPSSSRDDPIRAPVPERGKELPVVYYDRSNGPAIRADVTYLKQDFSAVQFVPKHGEWPSQQRFDFMVRQRTLSNDEVAKMTASGAGSSRPELPATRGSAMGGAELTGLDAGNRSEDWYQTLIEEWKLLAP